MKHLLSRLSQLRQYPSAIAGIIIIFIFILVSVLTLIFIPYSHALELWRGGETWRMHPVNAEPVWLDRLIGGNKPRTKIINTTDHGTKEEAVFEGGKHQRIIIGFDYEYTEFPSEINLFLKTTNTQKESFLKLTWITPAGEKLALGERRISAKDRISISQNKMLEQRLGQIPHVGLFMESGNKEKPAVLNGSYKLQMDVILFGEGSSLEADLVIYGRVHGLAGTDHQRRDLMVALLWGIPIALAFGLLAAVGTTITTLIIAAAGVWFGGWIDATIQRLTEINMILPLLPILVMVGALYSTSIWLMLGVVVALGIFSAGIKMYRAMLLPLREAPYIEAARAYGASSSRIILKYMIPRVLPVLIPSFVTLIPSFVFLEASLAVLGLGDPVLPTWGKILNDAQVQSALYNGFYYWVTAPAILLMLTGLGFAMLGFALDRIFNPRLRTL